VSVREREEVQEVSRSLTGFAGAAPCDADGFARSSHGA
jgi:hypothetical protein